MWYELIIALAQPIRIIHMIVMYLPEWDRGILVIEFLLCVI